MKITNSKNPEAIRLANVEMIPTRIGIVLNAESNVRAAAHKEMASRSFGLSQMAADINRTIDIVGESEQIVTEVDATINLAAKSQASAVVEQAEAITAAVPPSIPVPYPSNITPVDMSNEQTEDSLNLADVRSKVDDIFNSHPEEELSF